MPDRGTGTTPRGTPWGETYDDLAVAVLADKSSPPVLALAAFAHQLGHPERLRSLIDEAVALNARGE